MLHAGGDGRSTGVGIIVNEEISNEVVRVERWQGRITAVFTMIRQQMVRVRRCCAWRAISMLTSVWLIQGRRKHNMKIWMGNKEQGRARTGGDVEEERVGGRGHVLPEEGEP